MRKVKRKFSYKKALKLLIPLLLVIIILINTNNIIYFCQSKITGYQFNTIKILHKSDTYKIVKKKEYSKTFESILKTKYYDKENINLYLDIDYYDKKDYLANISKLIKLGYNANDINMIYKVLSDDSISLVLSNKYLANMADILNLSYFIEDNLLRYIDYSLEDSFAYEDLVTYVNIGLDNDYYTKTTEATNTDSELILVNKYNYLDSDYVPSDLEAISSKYNKGSNNKMRTVAKNAFESMCEAALKDDIKIYSGSAYRSYNYQLNLYNRYVKQDGKKEADRYSARAGYSEHQTGLATDIMKANWEFLSKDDKEYEWLLKNSYKYGFILRYPSGKEDITGYMEEEWHFRYVGIKVAKEVYDADITYDEYMARQVKK